MSKQAKSIQSRQANDVLLELKSLLEQGRFDAAGQLAMKIADSPVVYTRDVLMLAGVALSHIHSWDIATNLGQLFLQGLGPGVEHHEHVSIVIPTHNRPELLRRALESVKAQTYPYLDVIVVNDAGVDVKGVCEEFKEDLEIKYLRQTENRFHSATRNNGIAHARGKYICFLDDDDCFYPYHVELMLRALKSSQARAVKADAFMFVRDPETESSVLRFAESKSLRLPEILIENVCPIQSVFMETSLLEECGGFDESLDANEDWDLWMRVCLRTAVAQLSLPTSFFESVDSQKNSVSRNRSPFWAAHAQIYQKQAVLDKGFISQEIKDVQEEWLKEIESQAHQDIVDEKNSIGILCMPSDDNTLQAKGISLSKCLLKKTKSKVQVVSENVPLEDALRQLYAMKDLSFLLIVDDHFDDCVNDSMLFNLVMHIKSHRQMHACASIDLREADMVLKDAGLAYTAFGTEFKNFTRIENMRGHSVDIQSPVSGALLLKGNAFRELVSVYGSKIDKPEQLKPLVFNWVNDNGGYIGLALDQTIMRKDNG